MGELKKQRNIFAATNFSAAWATLGNLSKVAPQFFAGKRFSKSSINNILLINFYKVLLDLTVFCDKRLNALFKSVPRTSRVRG